MNTHSTIKKKENAISTNSVGSVGIGVVVRDHLGFMLVKFQEYQISIAMLLNKY